MADFSRFRSSRSSYDDCAFFAANEYSQGGSLPIQGRSMTTDFSPASAEVVDFYQMIDQPRNATTIQLRSRINELYAEAQVNRDHRNVEKRQSYARLLQWIPPLRTILLHEGKRARYDALLDDPQSGAGGDFRTSLNDLLGENDFDFGEGESILAIRDGDRAAVTEIDATPRLSSRLDAVAAAAGAGAVRASAAAREIEVEARQTSADAPANAPANAVTDAAPAVLSQARRAEVVAPSKIADATVAPATNAARNAATNAARDDLIAQKASDIIAQSTAAPTVAAPTGVSSPDSTSNIAASNVAAANVAAANVATSSTRSVVREPARESVRAGARKTALHPDLVRERASLMSSAAGVSVVFLVLLTLRAMFGVESNLAALVGVALVAGFVTWRALRRLLTTRIER